MTISIGDTLPSAQFFTMADGGPEPVGDEFFAGRTVALFAVPGAFTPTCSAQHLPGFVEQADALRAKGVDAIACTAVNDVFVMGAWAARHGVGDGITLLADGNGDFADAIGLTMDGSAYGLRHAQPALHHAGGRPGGEAALHRSARGVQGELGRAPAVGAVGSGPVQRRSAPCCGAASPAGSPAATRDQARRKRGSAGIRGDGGATWMRSRPSSLAPYSA